MYYILHTTDFIVNLQVSWFGHYWLKVSKNKKAMLLQVEPCDAAVNFDMYRILPRHRVVSVPQHGFLVGLCLQTMLPFL